MTLACFLGGLEESRGPQGKKLQEASYDRSVQSRDVYSNLSLGGHNSQCVGKRVSYGEIENHRKK